MRLLAVVVVLYRTTTEETALVHGVWQLHHHTETEHSSHLFITVGRYHLLGDVEANAIVEVGDAHLRACLTKVVVCNNLHAVATCSLLCIDVGKHQLWVAPHLVFVLQSGTHVVVGHCAPEVRLQCASLAENRLAVNNP